ncbi:hypothetical protein Tco_0194252 [Tanacetum coccineum]
MITKTSIMLGLGETDKTTKKKRADLILKRESGNSGNIIRKDVYCTFGNCRDLIKLFLGPDERLSSQSASISWLFRNLYMDLGFEKEEEDTSAHLGSPFNQHRGDTRRPAVGTHKSQPLPEGKTTDPKDSGGNDQPVDKGLPSTVPDEGIGKTTHLSEGLREDKDSERLKPLADTESQTPSVIAISGADAGYQVDYLRYRSLTKTKARLPLLLSDDERIEESDDDVFEASDEMDEDIYQADEEETQSPKHSKESSTEVPTEEPISQEHQSHIPHKEQPESSHARDTDASDSES